MSCLLMFVFGVITIQTVNSNAIPAQPGPPPQGSILGAALYALLEAMASVLSLVAARISGGFSGSGTTGALQHTGAVPGPVQNSNQAVPINVNHNAGSGPRQNSNQGVPNTENHPTDWTFTKSTLPQGTISSLPEADRVINGNHPHGGTDAFFPPDLSKVTVGGRTYNLPPGTRIENIGNGGKGFVARRRDGYVTVGGGLNMIY